MDKQTNKTDMYVFEFTIRSMKQITRYTVIQLNFNTIKYYVFYTLNDKVKSIKINTI